MNTSDQSSRATFILDANKNRLTVRKGKPVTSGSVNVYTVQFEFSDDWNGLERIAVFKAKKKSWSISRSILLDETNACEVPWEVLTTPGALLQAGVYGTRDGEVVLPTNWATLEAVLQGVTVGPDAQPPTLDVWEQELAQKGDKLGYDGLNLSLMAGDEELSSVPIGDDIKAAGKTAEAKGVMFEDGQTFQQKYDNGELTGPQGIKGEQGNDGPAGTDGVSPKVAVTDIAGGHKVTITDAAGPKEFNVMNGQDGEPGEGVPDGGNPGQVLTKTEDGTTWADPTGGRGTAGVSSFNDRSGAVMPQDGDYENVYSEEETVVGRWIDGRPLYRVAYVFPATGNPTYYTITNIDINNISVKSITGGVNYSKGFFPFGFFFSETYYSSVRLDETTGNRIKVEGPYAGPNIKATVILEYTKTTDEPVSVI